MNRRSLKFMKIMYSSMFVPHHLQIDKTKKYRVRKYEYDRALQDYSVISYKIKEI